MGEGEEGGRRGKKEGGGRKAEEWGQQGKGGWEKNEGKRMRQIEKRRKEEREITEKDRTACQYLLHCALPYPLSAHQSSLQWWPHCEP